VNLGFAKYVDRYLGILLCYTLAALYLFREMIWPHEGTIRVRRILMVKLWGIGNLVLLLPIIGMVRRRYPRAEIHFLTLSGNLSLLEGNPNLDRIWTVREGGSVAMLASLIRNLSGLRRAGIDLFLDFEQFARTSTLFGFLIGAPQRVGFHTPRQGRYLLYTAPVNYRNDHHMSGTFMDIARAAGIREEEYRVEPVHFSDANAARARGLLAGITGRYVVFHVGSGDNFIGRRWPPESFAELADRLIARHGISVVFSGTADESHLVADVARRMSRRDRTVDLSGRMDLKTLTAVLTGAEFLVSNDTGPVHIASSLGRPVLGLYGPNTPVLYGPLSPGSRSFYKNLPCSPCITNLNYKTSFCRLTVCIRNITVDEVEDAASGLLEEEASPAVSGEVS